MRAEPIASAAALDDDGATPAAVDLAPPPREVRLAFARHLLSAFARRALADLGLIPGENPAPADGIPGATRAFLVDRYPNGARSDATAAGKVDAG